LKSAENAYFKLKSRVKTIHDLKHEKNTEEPITEAVEKYKNDFKACLEDDLNTANAITVLFDVLKADDLNDTEKVYLIKDFEKVLSLGLMEFEDEKSDVDDEEVKYIEEMIQKRTEAKKSKDFALADSIRNELLEKGIVLEDTRQGVNWKKIK